MKTISPKSTISQNQKSRGRRANGAPNLVDIHIGKRIKLRRQILKLSQQQLSQMLGITFQQTQKYEKGINRISGSRLWDFACILGVDVNFFFMDMNEATQQQSPRYINDKRTDYNTTLQNNPLLSNRYLEIIKAFEKIKNPQLAENLYNLIMNLSLSPYILN